MNIIYFSSLLSSDFGSNINRPKTQTRDPNSFFWVRAQIVSSQIIKNLI